MFIDIFLFLRLSVLHYLLLQVSIVVKALPPYIAQPTVNSIPT